MRNIEKIKQTLFVLQQIGYQEQKKRNAETSLGFLWNILNPLLYMIILSTYYMNVIIHDIDRFPVFVFTGITIYNYYNTATKGALKSLVNNKNLLIKTKQPVDIFIKSKIYEGFREFLFSSIAIIPIFIAFKVRLTWRALLVIPILLITTLIISSIGKILAIWYVYFADIDYLYSVLMTMLIFVSGTFLPLGRYPASIKTALTYNPIFLSIYLYRNSLLYGIPSYWTAWVKFIVWAILLFIYSNWLFEKKRDDCINRL
ncbi:ABC transporter permease [Pseudobutyrivibrio ruminis]|uniref:ABC transporter permease n=1 Tax=Pseudobutyrivibrio ruminis TaxID=46206 RepID=UPI000418B24B|nr:ABC transporter permease [Pseudobutyrivibrio ruminis]